MEIVAFEGGWGPLIIIMIPSRVGLHTLKSGRVREWWQMSGRLTAHWSTAERIAACSKRSCNQTHGARRPCLLGTSEQSPKPLPSSGALRTSSPAPTCGESCVVSTTCVSVQAASPLELGAAYCRRRSSVV